jgi:hypothetical protein
MYSYSFVFCFVFVFFFLFLDMSTQEEGEGFELKTSASLGVVPADLVTRDMSLIGLNQSYQKLPK